MELTSPALPFRQIRVTILTTLKLKLRVQLLHCIWVRLPPPVPGGHPLLADVWARLVSVMQSKQLLLTTPRFCVKAQVAAGGVCNGSASQHSIFLVALSPECWQRRRFSYHGNSSHFSTLTIIMIIVFVCLIPYFIKRKQIVFPLTEELDPKVLCYCGQMHITCLLAQYCFIILFPLRD